MSKFIPKEHQDAMVEAYLSGKTLEDSAAPFAYCGTTCKNILVRRGLKPRSYSEAGLTSKRMRHHAVDENFFDLIDNEEKAYWLGFITADGSITPKALSIELHERDIEHLHKFASALKAEHTIGLRTGSKAGKVRPIVGIQITSVRVVKALMNLGVTPNKTFGVRPCQEVPESLLPHYWRGVFDGDGCITTKSTIKKPDWKFILVGNEAIINGFVTFISRYVISKARSRPRGKIFCIEYGGNHIAKAIAEILYSNSTVYLERKWLIAQKVLGNLDEN